MPESSISRRGTARGTTTRSLTPSKTMRRQGNQRPAPWDDDLKRVERDYAPYLETVRGLVRALSEHRTFQADLATCVDAVQNYYEFWSRLPDHGRDDNGPDRVDEWKLREWVLSVAQQWISMRYRQICIEGTEIHLRPSWIAAIVREAANVPFPDEPTQATGWARAAGGIVEHAIWNISMMRSPVSLKPLATYEEWQTYNKERAKWEKIARRNEEMGGDDVARWMAAGIVVSWPSHGVSRDDYIALVAQAIKDEWPGMAGMAGMAGPDSGTLPGQRRKGRPAGGGSTADTYTHRVRLYDLWCHYPVVIPPRRDLTHGRETVSWSTFADAVIKRTGPGDAFEGWKTVGERTIRDAVTKAVTWAAPASDVAISLDAFITAIPTREEVMEWIEQNP